MYFNPHDKEIQFHTLTINYKKRSGESLAPSSTKSIKYIPGVEQEIVVTPENIEGYTPVENKKTISVPTDNVVDFIYSPVLDPSKPLTFKIISGGTINWKAYSQYFCKTIQYKKNDDDWATITSNTGDSAPSISVNAGDVVQFRGDNATYCDSSYYYNSFSGSIAKFEIEGNIMSLIDSTNFATETTLASSNTFNCLFRNCGGLISAENLVLPATTLTSYCYQYMFYNCTSLTTAPELPATTLVSYCYYGMFQGCTSLATAPELPATALTGYCYSDMFHGCISLTTAPELPVKTMATGCYYGMFSDCTSLATAPELPATTLASECYSYMFSNCTSLNYIKCLATNISASYCTSNWVNGVASSGTFVKDASMTRWTTGNNGIPEGWTCVNDNDTFVLSQESVVVPLSGGSKTIGVYSLEANWSAETNDNWVTVSPTTGEGGMLASNVLISISSAESARTGSVIFTNGTNVLSLMVAQKREAQPLTFNVLSGGTILWMCNVSNSRYARTISYSKDNGATWSKVTSTYSGAKILVNSGDKILFKGNSSLYESNYYNYFGTQSAMFSIEGNIMSLIDSTNFATATTIASSYTFYHLFGGCTGLTSAENLILPATTLTSNCCEGMFSNCTSLTTAPSILPATTLAYMCYDSMFRGCTSLTTAPGLPATALAGFCYYRMFSGCTSLTTAPELPATTLAGSCYGIMFRGCTSLTQAPELPATTLASNCYQYMFYGCTGLTTAPSILPATTLANYCYSNMFNGCNSLTRAPELPATTLANYCYENMFFGCTSLNYIKCLATYISASYCTYEWIFGVASSGTFVKNTSMSSWTTGNSGIPTNWTVQDAS